jgi:hypothetical protein
MIDMYYILWATKAKEDYIGTYTTAELALEVANALDLTDYLIEPHSKQKPVFIEVRKTKI